MKYLIIKLFLTVSILLTGSASMALELREAELILSSKQYELESVGYDKITTLRILEAQYLIDKNHYKEAFIIIKSIDEQPVFEGSRYNLVPDLAIVAKAAGIESDYKYYRNLAFDIDAFFLSKAKCIETPTGFDLDTKLNIKYKNELVRRLCSAFTLDKTFPSNYFTWKIRLLI
jgi:hypothetical protein